MCLVFLLKIITGGKVVLLRCKNSMSWLRKVVTDKRPHASARGRLGCPWFGPWFSAIASPLGKYRIHP